MLTLFHNENKDNRAQIPLPDNIVDIIIHDCTAEEKQNLLNNLVNSEKFVAQRILNYVVLGQQDKVDTILKEFRHDKAKLITLLSPKHTVRDLSGRVFQAITPFQYSLWALDRHMWTMLLHYLPQEIAAIQLKELETTGVTYKKYNALNPISAMVVKHEKQFNFLQLISALENYIMHFEHYRINHLLEKAWRTGVGLVQRDIPVNIVNEYCHPNRAFYPTPTFDEATLPRLLHFYYNDWPYNYSTWYSDQVEKFSAVRKFYVSGVLGEECAIFRGKEQVAQVISKDKSFDYLCAKRSDAIIDLYAIKSLYHKRMDEYQHLKKKLENKHTSKPLILHKEAFFKEKTVFLRNELELDQIKKQMTTIPNLETLVNPTIYLKKIIEIDTQLNKIETLLENERLVVDDLKQIINNQMNALLRFIAAENETKHINKLHASI